MLLIIVYAIVDTIFSLESFLHLSFIHSIIVVITHHQLLVAFLLNVDFSVVDGGRGENSGAKLGWLLSNILLVKVRIIYLLGQSDIVIFVLIIVVWILILILFILFFLIFIIFLLFHFLIILICILFPYSLLALFTIPLFNLVQFLLSLVFQLVCALWVHPSPVHTLIVAIALNIQVTDNLTLALAVQCCFLSIGKNCTTCCIVTIIG